MEFPTLFDKNPRTARLTDIVWLALLCAYVLAGIPTASFHGDEAMQIHMSRDYATAFLDGTQNELITAGPFPIDSDPHLRIINGSVNRYTIGLSWHLAGYMPEDLPPPPGWDWGLNYDDGVATDHRPDDALLAASRLPSTLFLCGGVVVLFGIAWLYGGRLPAYVASGLYALHPVILLNGRRAMQEGSMLFFGLLVVLVGAVIGQRRARDENAPLWLWALLVASGGLTLASKHSGIVFVGVALLWVLVAEMLGRRRWLPVLAKLVVSGLLIVALFVAISPALWSDPLARFGDLLYLRDELLNIQVAIDPIAPMDFGQRIVEILRQPFMTPAVHFELPSWGESAAFMDEVERASTSPLAGLPLGVVLGLPLTLLAGMGIVTAVRRARQPLYTGLLLWLAANVAVLLVNPLPWQRYYLSIIPVAAVLAALGLTWLVTRFRPPETT
jgi:4-amino-4-deoxy-L-arabinose transferase-like glycosyltransferase